MAETRILQYYYEDERHIVFEKYTIDSTGVIKNKKTGKELSLAIDASGYYKVGVRDTEGEQRKISVARAVASTFLGKPPTTKHTADHIISSQKLNNDKSNIRWACKSGQAINRNVHSTLKSAFIIVKDGLEMTAKEWKNIEYTCGNSINYYAQNKLHGFSYKEYPDLEGEVWKRIKGSETSKGYWEISNKSRVKQVTNHSENVLFGDRFVLQNGYPVVNVSGKQQYCHILAYEAFYPDDPRGKTMVLHKHDNKLDFSPENLRLGTASENANDARDNGKHDGTRTARMKCVSYINGKPEKQHESQTDAVEYLRSLNYEKASDSAVCRALSGGLKSAYGRTWKPF